MSAQRRSLPPLRRIVLVVGGGLLALLLLIQLIPYGRDHTNPHVFVTVDRWTSPEHYNAFADANAEEYQRIDAKYAPMCVSEKRVGDYDMVVPA